MLTHILISAAVSVVCFYVGFKIGRRSAATEHVDTMKKLWKRSW